MTLAEIERFLSERGLRLRRAVRVGRRREYEVEVATEDGTRAFQATGKDLQEAVEAAVKKAEARPRAGKRHRY